MNWLFTLNVVAVGGGIGWAVGNYFDVGLVMTFVVAVVVGVVGLGLAWWLQKHWG